EEAMVDFALEWLEGLYGSNFTKVVKRASATRWYNEPWVLGSFSCASVGGQPSRRVLMEPMASRMWFAGEAVDATVWGGVGGRLGIRRARRRRSAQAHRRGGRAAARGGAAPARAATPRALSFGRYPRNTPPVRLPTSATILAATASIS